MPSHTAKQQHTAVHQHTSATGSTGSNTTESSQAIPSKISYAQTAKKPSTAVSDVNDKKDTGTTAAVPTAVSGQSHAGFHVGSGRGTRGKHQHNNTNRHHHHNQQNHTAPVTSSTYAPSHSVPNPMTQSLSDAPQNAASTHVKQLPKKPTAASVSTHQIPSTASTTHLTFGTVPLAVISTIPSKTGCVSFASIARSGSSLMAEPGIQKSKKAPTGSVSASRTVSSGSSVPRKPQTSEAFSAAGST